MRVMSMLCGLLLTALSGSLSAECPRSYFDEGCGANGEWSSGNYECPLGSFQGITAYSNGGWTATACGDYQCVEFVKRFYDEEVDNALSSLGSPGYAVSAFSTWHNNDGLYQYANGESFVPPAAGDIYCQSGNTYGHVAIIKSVDLNAMKVVIIDQNRSNISAELERNLYVDGVGKYSIQSIGQSYTTQGWLRDPNYIGPQPIYKIALPTSQEGGAQFVNNELTNQTTMTAGGPTKRFKVRYKNLCNFTWSKNQSDPNWVGLMSCMSNGSTINGQSFLNNPWNSSLGWMPDADHAHVTSFNEASVPPGVIATFEFDGYIPSGASPTSSPVPVYFSLHHATHGFISDGWGGLSFQVNVVDPELSGENFVAFTGDFNGDGKGDVGLWETTTGTWYVAMCDLPNKRYIPEPEPWLENWAGGGGYKLVVADFSGDGYDEICVYHPGTGRWFVAYNQYSSTHHFVPASGPYANSSWIDGWATGSSTDYIPMTGKYNGDALFDIAVFHPVTGRWYVAYNSGSKSFASQGLWLDDWGDGSYGTYWPFTGRLNTDGYHDIGCYHPGTGRWFGAYRSGASFAPSGGVWLDSWATGSSTTWKNFFGKSSSDAYDDVIVYKPSEGKWCVAYNWNGYFAQANGAGANGAWLTGWAVEDGTLGWQTFTKDVTGDGYVDLIAYTPKYGRWFVAYNNAGPPPFFNPTNGTDYNNSWLDGWGIETEGSPKLADESPPETVPSKFALSQNYPNPFNPATTISYSLPSATHVRLDVFNILGQKVATLVDEHQTAGEHTVLWESVGFSSGIYLYRLSTPEAVETRKMILLK